MQELRHVQLPENMNNYHEVIEYHLYRLEYYTGEEDPREVLVEKCFCKEALSKTISANRSNTYVIKEIRMIPLEYKLKDLEDRLKKLEELYEKKIKEEIIRN
jgi:phosphopantetheinyl transferase (holo-ACP synthase)